MPNSIETPIDLTPDYLDRSNRPSWIKGSVDHIRNEAAARGLASTHSSKGTLRIWDPNTNETILFEETKRIGSNEFLM